MSRTLGPEILKIDIADLDLPVAGAKIVSGTGIELDLACAVYALEIDRY
jgi:hypothetical protein